MGQRTLKMGISLFSFLCLSFLLQGRQQFADEGVSLSYMSSILQDFDFNIINQVHDGMNWLVTKSYYHPDFRSEIQTPILLIFTCFEKLIIGLMSSLDHQLRPNVMATFTLNFGLIGATYILMKDYCRKMDLVFYPKIFFLLTLGSAYFYYSSLISGVMDIFAIPVFIFSLIQYEDIKKVEKGAFFQSFLLGFSLGIISLTGLLYWPLALYLLADSCWFFWEKKMRRQMTWLLLSFLMILSCELINQFMKYGGLISPQLTLRFFFDLSPLHLLEKLLTGYFAKGGVFFVNPLFLLSLLGLVFFVRSYILTGKMRKSHALVKGLWIILVFCHTLPMMGINAEGELPGRIYLSTFPFLFMGLSYLAERKPKFILNNIFLELMIIWNFINVFSFISIDLYDRHAYSSMVLPSAEILVKLLDSYWAQIEHNFLLLVNQEVIGFFLMATLFSLLFSLAITNFKKVFSSLVVITAGSFTLFTLLNVLNGNVNVVELGEKDFYVGKVIGDGSELYFYNDFMDIYANLERGAESEKRLLLEERKKQYFKVIESQIITSTGSFNDQLRIHIKDKEFWKEREKKPTWPEFFNQ